MKPKYTDTQLLDFLQQQTDKSHYTGRVIMRDSSNGRGWRIHECEVGEAIPDVREAIVKYIEEKK